MEDFENQEEQANWQITSSLQLSNHKKSYLFHRSAQQKNQLKQQTSTDFYKCCQLQDLQKDQRASKYKRLRKQAPSQESFKQLTNDSLNINKYEDNLQVSNLESGNDQNNQNIMQSIQQQMIELENIKHPVRRLFEQTKFLQQSYQSSKPYQKTDIAFLDFEVHKPSEIRVERIYRVHTDVQFEVNNLPFYVKQMYNDNKEYNLEKYKKNIMKYQKSKQQRNEKQTNNQIKKQNDLQIVGLGNLVNYQYNGNKQNIQEFQL